MVEVEDDQSRGDDAADAPGAEADVAQRFERHLQQSVAAFPDRTHAVVCLVELLLQRGECGVFRLLERHGDRVGFTFVTEVAEATQIGCRFYEGGQDLAVGTDRGGVVLAAGSHLRGPDRPAVRHRDNLDVAAVVGVLPDHHRSTPGVGPGVPTRSVSISIPSMFTWLYPAALAASNAPCRLGARAASTSTPSCR